MSINVKEFYEFMSTHTKPSMADGITFSSLNNLFNDRLRRNHSDNLAYRGVFIPLVELYVIGSGQPYVIENRNRIRKLKGWTYKDSNMLKLASLLENGLVNETNQKEANRLFEAITHKIESDQEAQKPLTEESLS